MHCTDIAKFYELMLLREVDKMLFSLGFMYVVYIFTTET
jgi:hypothetical protein